MDSSISQDPFAPDTPAPKEGTVSFPANRFIDAGATPDELAAHQAAFDALPEAAQQARSDELAAVATGDLAEQLEQARAVEVPDVEKLAEKQWTHDETEEVFATKREATEDAQAVAEPVTEPEPVVGVADTQPVDPAVPEPEPEPPAAV